MPETIHKSSDHWHRQFCQVSDLHGSGRSGRRRRLRDGYSV